MYGSPTSLLSEFLSGLSGVASNKIPAHSVEEIILLFCPVLVVRISKIPRPILPVHLSIVQISNAMKDLSDHKSIGQSRC